MTPLPNSLSIKALVRLARPQNAVFSGLLASMAVITSKGSWQRALFCYVLMVSLYAVAASINNLVDVATDIKNKRVDNPVATGEVTPRTAYKFIAANIVVIFSLQIVLTQPASIICAGLYCLALLVYSVPKSGAFQRKGFLGHVILAVCYASIPLALGMSQAGNIRSGWLFLACLQIPLVIPLLLAKDYKDEIGDRATNKHTPLVLYGKKKLLIFVTVFLLFSVAILWKIGSPAISLTAFGIYTFCAYFVHFREGRIHGHLLRLPQLALLMLNFQLISSGGG